MRSEFVSRCGGIGPSTVFLANQAPVYCGCPAGTHGCDLMAEEMTEERTAPRAANLTGTVAGTKEALETGRGKGKSKSETQQCHDCGEQGQIGVNCPYKGTNSKDEDDQGSSWESELEGEKSEELASPQFGERCESQSERHSVECEKRWE